jgi:hypothetical protein
MSDATELLFSYGTLQLEPVQRATFGRVLEGTADALPGYALDRIPIRDPQVVATSGETHHRIVRASGRPADRVPGVVFRITPAELAHADAYEVDDYQRVRCTLASGTEAWVYVEARPPRDAAPEGPPWRIELLEEPRVVLIDGAGELTMAQLLDRATQALAVGRDNDCTRFVFDDRWIVPRVSTAEIYAMPAAMERVGWARTMRVANVYDAGRPAAVEEYRMFSGISISRGFAYCLFTELEAAMAWAAA